MGKSAIEWTEHTWEPVQGCTPVSAGCRNCYAERLATGRLRRFYPDGFGKVITRQNKLDQPLHWRKPARIFVCSRSDLFHPDVPDEFIDSVFFAMTNPFSNSQRHTFLILTKRIDRVLKGAWSPEWKHIWLGVSVEDQQTADKRIPILLQIPAAMRFVSYEPALGPVDFSQFARHGLDWLIIGCESGPHRRPFVYEWAEQVIIDCWDAGVPVFMKQIPVNGRVSRDPAEWPLHFQRREYPNESKS